MVDATTSAAQITRFQAMLNALKDEKTQPARANIDGCQTAGSLSYLLALASVIVNDDRSTYSVGSVEESSSTSGVHACGFQAKDCVSKIVCSVRRAHACMASPRTRHGCLKYFGDDTVFAKGCF